MFNYYLYMEESGRVGMIHSSPDEISEDSWSPIMEGGVSSVSVAMSLGVDRVGAWPHLTYVPLQFRGSHLVGEN